MPKDNSKGKPVAKPSSLEVLDRHRSEVGLRLYAVMLALGLNQAAFARKMGVGPTTMNQYLTTPNKQAMSRPALEIAIQICDRVPGLTLDWLYRGRYEGMPVVLADALMEKMNELDGFGRDRF